MQCSLGGPVNVSFAAQMLEKLLDRSHLTDGKPHPYSATGKGYSVITQVRLKCFQTQRNVSCLAVAWDHSTKIQPTLRCECQETFAASL